MQGKSSIFLLRNFEKSEILITFATEQQKYRVMCALHKTQTSQLYEI